MPDLKARELWAVGPLIALIIVFGVYPQPLLNIINPAVHRTLVQTHSTDPVPPHPARVVVHVGKGVGGTVTGAVPGRAPAVANGTVTRAVLGPANTSALSQKGTAP